MTKSDLELLIGAYGNDIYRFCFHLTGSQYDADDLYQDTLCKAYEIRRRIAKSEEDSYLEKERNYCLGIAIRLYKNSYRKKARQNEESLDNEEKKFGERLASEYKTEDKVVREELQMHVRNCIRQLPLKQRTVIYLFYYADLPIKDIGKLLRIPVGTVKSRLNKAKSSLKKELEEIRYE